MALDARVSGYDIPSHEQNSFVLEAGDIVDYALQGYLPEHAQEGPDLLPLPFEYDYSTRPAGVVARNNSDPSVSCPFPVPTTGGDPQFPLAHASYISTPTIMSAPLPEAGTSGRIADAPQTSSSAQSTMQLGGGKRPRAEEEDTPRTPRSSKKSKGPREVSRITPTRPVVEKNRASRAIAAPRPASPVAGPSNLRGVAAGTEAETVYESDADSDTDNDDDHVHDGTGSTLR